LEINLADRTTDPTPSPSPGPPPTPPPSKPKGWQVKLDPPSQASKALADYIVKARSIFQDVAHTLGTPDYAVPPPVIPPANPSVPAADMTTGLAGFAAASYSTSQNVLQRHSAGWHDTDGTVVTITQRAATVGSMALQQVKDLVYRLQDVLNAANLDRAVPASYTEHPSAGDGLTSYAEYRLAITVERTLQQAGEVLRRAHTDLRLEGFHFFVPAPPIIPEGIVPPQPVPMPELQRHPQGPMTLEV
jgi:hypothetical protein